MRVLGIDCGSEITGYGVVEEVDGALHFVAGAAIRLNRQESLPQRLGRMHRELNQAISVHTPEIIAIEDVFYSTNVKSALKLGHVRGVAMLAAANHSLEVAEYAPLAIKSAVVGYGRAEKAQVQEMVARLLRLQAPPEPADIADALAIAICHLHTQGTLTRQLAGSR